jgi:hypothetical protein
LPGAGVLLDHPELRRRLTLRERLVGVVHAMVVSFSSLFIGTLHKIV